MAVGKRPVVGLDVGSECVKAVVLAESELVLGRSVVPVRGYFQDRIREALDEAFAEARLEEPHLLRRCATGFAAPCAGRVDRTVVEAEAHAAAARRHLPEVRTVLVLGGPQARALRLDRDGRWVGSRTLRRCSWGVGTFLATAARRLDVHPSRLMELAGRADRPADVGSWCSVLAEADLVERLRDGATREEVARGCLYAAAERVLELGKLRPPLAATGGVAASFPGVVEILAERLGQELTVVPEPILAGARGAALLGLGLGTGARGEAADGAPSEAP